MDELQQQAASFKADRQADQADDEDAKGTIYEAQKHSEQVLKLLKEDSKYCDITLEAGEETIKIHKSLFGTYSDFFDKAFNAEMKEKNTNKVKLEEITGDVLRSVVDFLYTGRICISQKNVFVLLAAADFLMITKIKEFCSAYLASKVDANNWLDTWNCGQKYAMEELVESSAIYVGKNLNSIIETENFKTLTAAQLEQILKISESFRSTEAKTYRLILSWIKQSSGKKQDEQPFRNCSSLMELVMEELISCNEELEEETEDLEKKLEEETEKLNLCKQKKSKLKTGAGFLLAFDEEKTAYKLNNWSITGKYSWLQLNPSNSNAVSINGVQYTFLGIMRERGIIEKDQDGKKRMIAALNMASSASNPKRNLTLVSLAQKLHAIEIGTGRLMVHRYNDEKDNWTTITEVSRWSASNLGDSVYAIKL